MRKTVFVRRLFITVLVLTLAFPVSVSAKSFNDVGKSDWYYPAVCFCSDTNIMYGVSTSSFAPEDNVTRGMFVTILGRYAQVDTSLYQKSVFADTDINIYYGPYVAWASEKGIVQGYDETTFGPERSMSREEMMAMLYRYECSVQGEVTFDLTDLDVFEDCENISDWAMNAVAWCVGSGLVQGYTSTQIAPQNTSTRAQICKIMYYRICDIGSTHQSEPTPGKRTLKNLFETALLPVGSTLYVYGGGWNDYDNGGGIETRTIGLSPQWKVFFDSNDASYNNSEHQYEIHNGLDCSAFVGWVLYNTLETENGKKGYVMKSTEMARTFASYGWGSYQNASAITKRQPGDIMSTDGHVYIYLGTMSDGSIVLVHSSPKGPMITGTYQPNGNQNSEAISLATYYMGKYFNEFYNRYPSVSRNTYYLTKYNQMSWYLNGSGVLTDPDGFAQMTPKQILQELLGK